MPAPLLIVNARLITPAQVYERGWLLCREGSIALLGEGAAPHVSDAQTIDATGLAALPGFIDLHVHGGAGRECMDADPESIRHTARFYAQHGVTGYLATTWTASRQRIQAALEVIAELEGPQPEGATLFGAHLEGPYLNPARCGAQDTQQIRRAARDEALALLDTGTIRLLALAPEYDDNLWLIEECVLRGITVSAAHTAATYADIERAVGLGLRQTTHTFNAMTGLNHREPGTVGAALTMPELSCELIADNIHVHPAVMKLLFTAKGVERIILITDAVRGAGMPDGSHYEQDGREVTVQDGAVRLPHGTLAGSALTMERALFNFAQAVGLPVETLWPVSSLNAAHAIGLASRTGSLEIGKDADLILVDESVNVHLTVARGVIVYRIGL